MMDYTYALLEDNEWGLDKPAIVLFYDEKAKTVTTFSMDRGVKTDRLTNEFFANITKTPADKNYLFHLLLCGEDLAYRLYKDDFNFREMIDTDYKDNPFKQLFELEKNFWKSANLEALEESDDKYEIRCLRRKVAQLEERLNDCLPFDIPKEDKVGGITLMEKTDN